MKCPICKVGDTHPGKATVTFERGQTTLVVKGVPASVCGNCAQEYLDEETTASLLQLAENAVQRGIQVEVRQYQAA